MGCYSVRCLGRLGGKLKVEELSAQRKKRQQERKRLSAQLRNEERKRQRILKKSQFLSNEDLVDVLTTRKSKAEAAAAKNTAKPPEPEAK